MCEQGKKGALMSECVYESLGAGRVRDGPFGRAGAGGSEFMMAAVIEEGQQC